jgi:hypothetical protein
MTGLGTIGVLEKGTPIMAKSNKVNVSLTDEQKLALEKLLADLNEARTENNEQPLTQSELMRLALGYLYQIRIQEDFPKDPPFGRPKKDKS